MRAGFFARLAWTGIRKNRKLYFPYILSAVGMVMMFFILQALGVSPLLADMRGGSSIGLVLTLGKYVIAVFALIFLFYTNSFLIRRRNREFGLYNVLGMDKHGISRVVLWESLIVAGFGLGGGIVLGIVFSKFAELGLLNAIRREVDYRFTVTGAAIGWTLLIFGVIFAILALRSLVLVRRARPLELLHSDNSGEKPPRANWLPALLGAILLAAAYTISVSIKTPLAALLLFFAAVIMVIIATYLLFISGSVALCRIMQKNKNYYYKKNHFVGVSSMAYRMKRNGAGIASVCILCTMVLVMISSTSSLYFGVESSLAARFPRENEITVVVDKFGSLGDENVASLRGDYLSVIRETGGEPENVTEFRCVATSGIVRDGRVNLTEINSLDPFSSDMDDLANLFFVSASDYNRATGISPSLTVAPGEAWVCTLRRELNDEELTFGSGLLTLRIAGKLDAFVDISAATTNVAPSLMFVVSDYDVLAPLEGLTNTYGDPAAEMQYYFGYDLDASDERCVETFNEVRRVPGRHPGLVNADGSFSTQTSCYAAERDDFFATYGGLFFLGIMLSIVFVFAAAMIIYYKQVSEGYEDQARFGIMRKVGMTKEDIKKSINAQILTVFFAPLLLAGVHLAFAFPMVWKVLQLFNLNELGLVIAVTVGAYLAFVLLYGVIYKLTARAYFGIVSASGD